MKTSTLSGNSFFKAKSRLSFLITLVCALFLCVGSVNAQQTCTWSGTITLTGPLSCTSITVTSNTTINTAGYTITLSGSLTVNNGAALTLNGAGELIVGTTFTVDNNSNSKVVVGDNFDIAIGGKLTVGNSNGGTFTMGNNGSLIVGGDIEIGNQSGAKLEVGNNCIVEVGTSTTPRNLIVGNTNGGKFIMGTDGKLTVWGNTTIGNSSGAELKTGNNSQIEIGGKLTVGDANGGAVNMGNNNKLTVVGDVQFGNNSGSKITGTGTTNVIVGGNLTGGGANKPSINVGSGSVKVNGTCTVSSCATNLPITPTPTYSAGVTIVIGVKTPTITVTGTPLSAFTTCPTEASPAQTFTVKGANLTANISIPVPAGYEISINGAAYTSTTPQTLTQAGGAVPVTTISIRLKSGGTNGATPGGTMALTSTGAVTQNITLTGSISANPIINLTHSITTSNLNYGQGTTVPPAQAIAVSASCLTGNVTVTAPADFEISTTSATAGFGQTATLAAGESTVWVRLKAGFMQNATPRTGTLTFTNGATTKNVTLSATVGATPTARNLYIQAGAAQDWGNLAHWGTGCGSGVGSVTSLPTEFDNVYICGGDGGERLVTIAAGTTAACKSLTFSNNNNNSVQHLSINGTLTVFGNVDATQSGNAAQNVTVGSSGSLVVTGNFDMGSQNQDATFTVNGTATIQGNLTVNVSKRGRVAGSGLLQVGGNFRFGNSSASWGTSTGFTLELTGCGAKTITIDKAMTVDIFRQSATCTTVYTKAGTATITTTKYDQNCNSTNLRPASGFGGGTGANLLNANCGAIITVTGTVPAMTTCVNTAGTPQSFTVKGDNLTNNLVVGPLTGYEFSTSSGGTYTNDLTFTPAQAATTQTIYVRLKSSATATTFAATTIPVTSSPATAKSVSIGLGTVSALALETIPAVTFDPVCSGTNFASKTFQIKGTCFTTNPTLTAASGYTISPTTVTAAQVNAGVTITISRTAAATFTNQTAVTISGGGLGSNVIVQANGTTNGPTITAISAVTFDPVCSGTNFASKTFQIKGTCFTTNPTLTAATGYTISPTTVTAAQVNAGVTITVSRSATATFTNQTAVTISGGGLGSSVVVQANGTTNNPTLTTTGTPTGFDYAECGTPPVKTFTVSGSCLTANTVITAPTNFQVSTDGTNWGTTATITTTPTITNQTISVRMAPNLTSGTTVTSQNITVASTNATTRNVAVSGTVTAQAAPGYTVSNKEGLTTDEVFRICGSGCNASYVLTFTYSASGNHLIGIKDGSTQITDANADYSGAGVSWFGWNGWQWGATGSDNNVTFYAKITKPGVSKAYDIVFSKTPFTCGPTIGATPNPVVFDAVCPTATYAQKTVTVTGSSLTSSLTITPQTGYAVQNPVGGAWETSAFTLANAATVNQVLNVRRNTAAPTAAFTGENAFIVSGGGVDPANNITVKANGTITTPSFTTVPNLIFEKCSSGTWNTQTFTIAGTCLGTVAIAAGTNFSVNKATATAGEQVTVTYTGGAATNATAVTLTAGTDASKTLTVKADATVVATYLNVTPTTPLNFTPICPGGTFDRLSFDVVGNCLPAQIAITKTAGFVVEYETGGNYYSLGADETVYLSTTNNAINQTLYLRYTGSTSFGMPSGATAVTIAQGTAYQKTISAKAEVKTPSFTIGAPSGNSDYFENSGPGGVITINASTNGCYATGFTTTLCNENTGDNAANFTITQGASLGASGGDIKVQLNAGKTAATYKTTVCITAPNGTVTKVPVTAVVSNVRVVYSNKSGNWCTAATWSSVSCAGGGTTDVPGKNPGTNQNVAVVICNGHTVDMDCDETSRVHSITVKSGGTLNLNLNTIATACEITVESGGTFKVSKDGAAINSKVTIKSGATVPATNSNIRIGENCNWIFEGNADLSGTTLILANGGDSGTGDACGSCQGKISSGGTLTIKEVRPKMNATATWIGGAIFQAATKTIITTLGNDNTQTSNNRSSGGGEGIGFNIHFIGPAEVKATTKNLAGIFKFQDGDLEFSGSFASNNAVCAATNRQVIEFLSPDPNSNLRFTGTAMGQVNKVAFRANVKGNIYFEKGTNIAAGSKDNGDAYKSANFGYTGNIEQLIVAQNVYFKNKFFVDYGTMNIKANLVQTGHAEIFTNNNASLHVSGNLNSQTNIACPSAGGYSLYLWLTGNATNPTHSYFTIGGNMWANITNLSNLVDPRSVMIVYGNAYMRGYTSQAYFGCNTECNAQNGTMVIKGKLVLDDIIFRIRTEDNVMDSNGKASTSNGDNRVYSGPRPANEYTENWGYSTCCPQGLTTAVVKDHTGRTVTGTEPGNVYSICGSSVITHSTKAYCSQYATQYPDHDRLEASGNWDCNSNTNHLAAKTCTSINGVPQPCTYGLYAITGGDFAHMPTNFPDGWLPIELTAFTAQKEGSVIVLNWTTLTETNNDYFTVLRSGNGITFESLAEVLGVPGGTTVVPQYYTYTDEHPLAGVSYYRLKQTDFNGEYSYSHIVPVYFQSAAKAFELFKTQNNGITKLECKFADVAKGNYVSVHAVTGKLLFETTVAPYAPTYAIELPLPAGVYLVSNLCNGVKTVVKVLVTN